MGMSLSRVCLVPYARGVGGPASFQGKFAAGLEKQGIQVCHSLDDLPYDAVLVVGGTRQLGKLRRARRMGIPIIQRLNGMNWLHRKLRTGVRHYLKAEYGNLLLSTIRRRLATGIVYQSHFAQGWWERVKGMTPVTRQVIYNGVDLDEFTTEGSHERPTDRYRILMVEGRLGGGYEIGLGNAMQLGEYLQHNHNLLVELTVAGEVPEVVKSYWEKAGMMDVHWTGIVPGDQIPHLDRSAHLLFSADLNAACPNAVVEALACGLPVLSFDTGALQEMVAGNAGRIVPYGGDPWQLDRADTLSLADAAAEILQDQAAFRRGARARAEEVFGLDDMVDAYLQVLSGEW
jgi:glycosyltransferase involved in cell wall biosynthesis